MSRIAFPKGFGLIEVMVGLVIGLIATIVMFQTFAVSERQKRTTTGAADAQTNGATGIFQIERDIKASGWGVDLSVLPNCSSFHSWYEGGTAPGISIFAPVIITDGGTDPASISINYFHDPSDAGFKFAKTTINQTMASADAAYPVVSTYGCNVKNLILVSGTNGCTLAQATTVTSSGSTQTLAHVQQSDSPYNPATTNMTGWPAYTSANNATVQCFPAPITKTYHISSNQLMQSSGGSDSAIAPEILDFRARYGVSSADGVQTISSWEKATDTWSASNLTLSSIRRIKAVQIALLARSATYEKPADGATSCTATTQDNVDSWPAWAGFDTTRLPSDWQCYRYKVFEITIPLRNILWAKT